MGTKKAKQKASQARGSVDKAQNKIIKSMEKRLKELESDVESKYNVDRALIKLTGYDGSTAISRSNNITEIPIAPAVGVNDFAQRVGDQVTLKHIDFSYALNYPYTAANTYTEPYVTCRVIVFWDNQPIMITSAGAAAANPVYYPQLLQNAISGATADADRKLMPLSERDWDNRKRFSIIHDKTHTLSASYSPGQATGGSVTDGGLGPRSCTGIIRMSKNYVGQKIRYLVGGGIVQNRKLYFCAFSSGSAPTTATPPQFAKVVEMRMQNRVIYTDA